MSRRVLRTAFGTLALTALVAGSAAAQSPQQFAPDATRYMALGDSIAAGYKAMPVTEGYAYRLYFGGAFDRVPHTIFSDIAVPGATSADVLAHQVPQAIMPSAIGGFNPKYITLTVGGNDLLSVLYFARTPGVTEQQIAQYAGQVFANYAANLGGILLALRTGLPDAKIFVANQYPLDDLQAATGMDPKLLPYFNQIVGQVVSQFPANVYLVDVYSAFYGKANLVEGERGQTPVIEVHPTNAGHRVIEQAFAEVITLVK
jgi:lysophospholipase L1-like esterase